MTSGSELYDDPRTAAGYAFDRPAVHEEILLRVRDDLQIREQVRRALDIGCGAGRSTAALAPLAAAVVGIDPSPAMLAHRRQVAPRAAFVVGRAERLPFPSGLFDLLTAAGSINYTELDLSLREAARVLARSSTIIIYDFSAGRRFTSGAQLQEWYDEFNRRYPEAPGYELEVERLPYERWGLQLEAYHAFDVQVPMTAEAYVRYAMSETRVTLAIRSGSAHSDILCWCRNTLTDVFGAQRRDVVFDAYTAYVRRKKEEGRRKKQEKRAPAARQP